MGGALLFFVVFLPWAQAQFEGVTVMVLVCLVKTFLSFELVVLLMRR